MEDVKLWRFVILMKEIGIIKPYPLNDYVKAILKIKKDTLLFNIPISFCEKNKINPDSLKELKIFKDSDKIMLVAQKQPEQPNEDNTTLNGADIIV